MKTTMLFGLKYAVMACLITITAACAVLDTSTLDTAVPLKPRKVQIGVNSAAGVELSSMIRDESESWEDESREASSHGLNAFWISYGADELNEITARAWLALFSGGAKFYLKHLLLQEGNTYVSILPGATYVFSLEDDEDQVPNFRAFGTEIQLLVTRKTSPNAAFTLGIRGNFNRYQSRNEDGIHQDEYSEPYNLVNYGIRGNIELKMGPLILLPELGVEFVPVIDGDFTVLPNLGLSLGLEL